MSSSLNAWRSAASWPSVSAPESITDAFLSASASARGTHSIATTTLRSRRGARVAHAPSVWLREKST